MTPPTKRAPADDLIDVRADIPREFCDVLDAWSQARGMTRKEAAGQIISEWVMARVHEHIVFERVTRGNPLLAQARGETPE